MTEKEAQMRAREALLKARALAGDNEKAVTGELLSSIDRDPQLHEALTKLGVARLWQSQNVRH